MCLFTMRRCGFVVAYLHCFFACVGYFHVGGLSTFLCLFFFLEVFVSFWPRPPQLSAPLHGYLTTGNLINASEPCCMT